MMGYKFQFVTLAAFHALNASMFDLAHNYQREGMAAYRGSGARVPDGAGSAATAPSGISLRGGGYFDEIQKVVGGARSPTTATQGLNRGRAVCR